MNRRLVGVFTFALVVASVTSLLAYRLIIARVQAPIAKTSVPANRLIVAARDLQVGALIKDSDLQEVSWPGPVPDQAIKTRQDMAGRGVTTPIYQNEPISEKRLAPRGAGAGLAATIPVGKRAVA